MSPEEVSQSKIIRREGKQSQKIYYSAYVKQPQITLVLGLISIVIVQFLILSFITINPWFH